MTPRWCYFMSLGKDKNSIWLRRSSSHISILNSYRAKMIGTFHPVRDSQQHTTKLEIVLRQILALLKRTKRFLPAGINPAISLGFIAQIFQKLTNCILRVNKVQWDLKRFHSIFQDAQISLTVSLLATLTNLSKNLLLTFGQFKINLTFQSKASSLLRKVKKC